jgi:K+-transporting ATPase A subunit
MMLLTLEKYFLDHGQLVIPGIGLLRLDQKNAQALDHEIQPPVEKIIFEVLDEVNSKPNKLFYIYLSDHLDCTIEQAMIDYTAFFTNQLSSNNTVELGNLGLLKSVNNTFSFQSNFNSSNYYQPITIEKVLTEDQDENNFNTSPSRWWILPIIIATIAILAILLK